MGNVFPLTPDATPGESPNSVSLSPESLQNRPVMPHFQPYLQADGAQPLTPPHTPPLQHTDRSSSVASRPTIATQGTLVLPNGTVSGTQKKLPVTEVQILPTLLMAPN
ncbi:hypothetical protein P154DRAFT_130819 [Amniculicola lignicola CBS 123094]|uniref:Uncharacterized protein n=1 Tax=Amniculicola lignicola CBS 123094 TaxID=1392246 RepID=A0A6A5WL09_9PLEO|nr:hypothetical protein P154DRAFT_130819 [Amniculicola lignicola CBS 123094]